MELSANIVADVGVDLAAGTVSKGGQAAWARNPSAAFSGSLIPSPRLVPRMDKDTLAAYQAGAAGFARDWHDQPPPADLQALVRRFFRRLPRLCQQLAKAIVRRLLLTPAKWAIHRAKMSVHAFLVWRKGEPEEL